MRFNYNGKVRDSKEYIYPRVKLDYSIRASTKEKAYNFRGPSCQFFSPVVNVTVHNLFFACLKVKLSSNVVCEYRPNVSCKIIHLFMMLLLLHRKCGMTLHFNFDFGRVPIMAKTIILVLF